MAFKDPPALLRQETPKALDNVTTQINGSVRELCVAASAVAKELGGKIVTVGSDSHDRKRAGENCLEAARQVAEIFGYVCTFENREPLFHSKKTIEKGR